MEDLDQMLGLNRPTPERPLAGVTVLVVEDSRFVCEALRLLCIQSGARIRRADCLAAARRHLSVYRPSAVIVDIGLPDGTGIDLIRELAGAYPRVEALIAISGDRDEKSRALAAGADEFLPKPIENLTAFQSALLKHLPREERPFIAKGGSVSPERLDQIALRDDLVQIAPTFEGQENGAKIDYALQFVDGIAKTAHDTPLEEAVAALAETRANGQSMKQNASRLAGLIRQRVEDCQAI